MVDHVDRELKQIVDFLMSRTSLFLASLCCHAFPLSSGSFMDAQIFPSCARMIYDDSAAVEDSNSEPFPKWEFGNTDTPPDGQGKTEPSPCRRADNALYELQL